MATPETIFASGDFSLNLTNIERALGIIDQEFRNAQEVLALPAAEVHPDIRGVFEARLVEAGEQQRNYEDKPSEVLAEARHIFDRGQELEMDSFRPFAIAINLKRKFPDIMKLEKLFMTNNDWGVALVEELHEIDFMLSKIIFSPKA